MEIIINRSTLKQPVCKVSVSYTHLDVYKRQPLINSGFIGYLAVRPFAEDEESDQDKGFDRSDDLSLIHI